MGLRVTALCRAVFQTVGERGCRLQGKTGHAEWTLAEWNPCFLLPSHFGHSDFPLFKGLASFILLGGEQGGMIAMHFLFKEISVYPIFPKNSINRFTSVGSSQTGSNHRQAITAEEPFLVRLVTFHFRLVIIHSPKPGSAL